MNISTVRIRFRMERMWMLLLNVEKKMENRMPAATKKISFLLWKFLFRKVATEP